MTDHSQWCYAHFLRPALRVLDSYHIAANDVLTGCGLNDSVLHRPYQLISHEQLAQFYINIQRLELPPSLGLEIGQGTGVTDKSAVGHAQLAAQTLRHIMVLGQKYMPMFMPLVKWDINIKRNIVLVNYSADVPLTALQNNPDTNPNELKSFLVDIILGMHISQAKLAYTLIAPKCLNLMFNKAEHAADYSSIFKGEIKYGAASTSLSYPMQQFDAQLPSYDQYMVDALEQSCEKMRIELQQGQDIVTAVSNQLTARPGHFPGLEKVALKLGTSPRNLRRQLQEQGCNYQSLLRQAKHQIAKDLLSNTRWELDEIAQLCGFSELRNFRSSFKKWQGLTPREYQLSQEKAKQ